MLNEAQISLTGYVATQPVGKVMKTGIPTVTMRVAWTPRRLDRVTGEWTDGNTSYVTVNCWRKLATNVAICVRKGDPVVVQGRLSVRTYNDMEGRPRTSVEVEASSVGHDLNRGVAQFARIRPQTGMTASEFAAAQKAGSQDGDADGGAGGTGQSAGAGGFGGNGHVPDFSMSGGMAAAADGVGPASADAWAGGDDGIPLPEEPDQEFFDEEATSEPSTAAAPESVSA